MSRVPVTGRVPLSSVPLASPVRPGVRQTCDRQFGGAGRPAPYTILNEFDACTTTEGAFVSGNGANWVETLYTWDHRNRLTGVTERNANKRATKKVEYDYDVYNRLLAKRADADANGTVDRGQTFIYDGRDIALVFDQSGSLTNRYLYGPALDQVFADENAVDGILWALSDNQGTVRDIAKYDAATDATTIVNHRKYDSFGRITSESNAALDFLFAYTGRFWDEDTQLQNNWNRWYDPRVGQWLSEDPIGFTAGDPNLYRYVGNSPTNFVDPTGLEGTEVYVQNRQLNPNSLAVRAPREHYVTHTFICVVDPWGNITTYSWGNEYRSDNPSHWYENRPEDLSAAREAERQRRIWNDAPWWEKPFLPDNFEEPLQVPGLAPYIDSQFRRLRELGEDSPSAHRNLGVIENCKSEVERLLREAMRQLARDLRKPDPFPPAEPESGKTTGSGVDIPDPLGSNTFDPPLYPEIFRPSPVFIEPRPAVVTL